MRILVVDDHEIVLEAICESLRKIGHDPMGTTNPCDVVDILHETGCRMVVSDWMMPDMNGLELCRQIRNADLPAYIYVILLTSREQRGPDDIVEALSAGADEFLTKPFHPDEMRARVRAGERILALETRDMAIFAMAKLAEFLSMEGAEMRTPVGLVGAAVLLLGPRLAGASVIVSLNNPGSTPPCNGTDGATTVLGGPAVR